MASGKPERPGDGVCGEKGQRGLLGRWKGQRERGMEVDRWRVPRQGLRTGSGERRTERRSQTWYGQGRELAEAEKESIRSRARAAQARVSRPR